MPLHHTALVADIGGTNTRVALATGAVIDRSSIQRFANSDYPGIEPILRAYLADHPADLAGACIAAAGPVRDGVAEMTNLNWTMSQASIAGATGAKTVALLNDLQAPGHALALLAPESLRQIIPGPAASPDKSPMATRLVMNVGTGFNAVPVHATMRGRIVPASECGHVSLPVHSADDQSLMAFVQTAHGFPSVEDVLSGSGLERVDHWAAGQDGAERKAADIMAAIIAGDDPRAAKAAAMFVRMMGVVAGNLALTHLPFGGIYLTGGVARHFSPHLVRFGFAHAFRDKGRFAEFMDAFAVWSIEDDYAALQGCAAHLADLIQS